LDERDLALAVILQKELGRPFFSCFPLFALFFIKKGAPFGSLEVYPNLKESMLTVIL
jgi:hypothetical protein